MHMVSINENERKNELLYSLTQFQFSPEQFYENPNKSFIGHRSCRVHLGKENKSRLIPGLPGIILDVSWLSRIAVSRGGKQN